MKLFGNSAGRHLREQQAAAERAEERPVPETEAWEIRVPEPEPEALAEALGEPAPAAPEPGPAPETIRETETTPETEGIPPEESGVRVGFASVEPLPPPPEVLDSEIVSADAAEYPAEEEAAPEKRSHRFLFGYLGCVFLFLVLLAAGLTVLWVRMDVYERSRPYRAMDQWMEGKTAADWRDVLSGQGVEDSYLDTLALNEASYVKKLGEYSDDAPVYSVRFGKKTMLTVTLKKGEALSFRSWIWELDRIGAVDSGLTVYAPEDAALILRGETLGPEYLTQRDAQSVTLGALEQGRDDIPGLAKYTLNQCFTVDYLTVEDAAGNPLELAYSTGNSYYYPPLTAGYAIEAPSAAAVTANGVALTEDNAEIARTPLEDFEGLEDFVPEIPAELRYFVDGLVARPAVEAVLADGTALPPAEETETLWRFALTPDADFRAEQESYILEVFDAYIAFLGNRGGNLYGNYYHYMTYVVPGSDAAERASKSLDSLYWVQGRDAALESVSLGDVLRYGDGCFTAWLDFTRKLDEETDDNNSYLFIFTRYNDQWRVVRVMNKTSFFLSGSAAD